MCLTSSARSNHTIRTWPPSESAEYAGRHDEGMWATVQDLLKEVPGSEQRLRSAEQVATLLARVLGFVVGRPSHDPPTHTSSG